LKDDDDDGGGGGGGGGDTTRDTEVVKSKFSSFSRRKCLTSVYNDVIS
jgi:hypothetical protein